MIPTKINGEFSGNWKKKIGGRDGMGKSSFLVLAPAPWISLVFTCI